MKKITFKFFAILSLMIASITNANAAATIKTINGTALNDYIAANPNFTGGDVLTVVVGYTSATSTTLNLRFLNDWTVISGATTATETIISGDANENEITFTLTVPEVNPAITTARLQVYGGASTNKSGFGIAAAAIAVNASASITSIDGQTPANYYTSVSGALIEGDVLTIGFDYLAVKSTDGIESPLVKIRFLDAGFTPIPEGTQVDIPVTYDESTNSSTADITVPNVGTNLSEVRIQIFVYGFNGTTDANAFFTANAGGLFSIDASTLSYNKAKLENVTVGSDAITFSAKYLNDEYTIYNITGQASQSGSISSEVSIESLVSGVYILTTDKGSLKFVK
ncbi:hypothetical protein [Wenyingzhuangia sp. IMCC45574]